MQGHDMAVLHGRVPGEENTSTTSKDVISVTEPF